MNYAMSSQRHTRSTNVTQDTMCEDEHVRK